MATYNGEAVIVRQLKSILQQLNDDDEVIIIDDGSSDQTLMRINELNDKRIKVQVNQQNMGPIKSFEKAIKLSQGEIIFLSDQDDCWYADKVATVERRFKDSQVQMVVHDARVVDGEGRELAPSWNAYNHNQLTTSVLRTIIKNPFTGSMMAFRQSLCPLILPFPSHTSMHDEWIGLVLNKKHLKYSLIDQPLMDYYRYGTNVTARRRKQPLVMLKKRCRDLNDIIKYH
ncbi:glycosyltransferase [Lactiplantibacillus fabifermentans]|nr:glycosyltransferase [Lactiplantibacillus fabifermentans]KRO27629.1 glycosyltransferase-like protein [Lactiplantibacillus fabifermentans DSM 21115]